MIDCSIELQIERNCMTWHRDIEPELISEQSGKTAADIEVIALNLYIDSGDVKSFIDLPPSKCWTLAVRRSEGDDELRILQKDGDILIQPVGMQPNFQHAPHGWHTEFWRIVITFRLIYPPTGLDALPKSDLPIQT